MQNSQNNAQNPPVIDLQALRHTTAHVLAQAVKRLYPTVTLAIGPAIADGFYYDFDVETPFTPEDLAKIEKEMKKIIKENLPLEQFSHNGEDALKFVDAQKEPYKRELIEDLLTPKDPAKPAATEFSFYKQGEFVDLCAGPHLDKTGRIKAFKLTSTAGAYWRGDEKRPMLSRIYGTAFPTKDELAAHLERIEEAKKRDHRKLGREMKLFAFMDEAPGMPFYLPKGLILKNRLIEYWRKVHKRYGYQEISTPQIMMGKLWERSGHTGYYVDNMFSSMIDESLYYVKPMNCPGGMLAYGTELHSYKEFPLRVAELGLIHRYELSGALHGLMRTRQFTQDDAHIFMMESQVKEEAKNVIRLYEDVYAAFGLNDFSFELSTRPENSIGSDEGWEKSTAALREALEEMGREYVINEGDGAFYGPKIDFQIRDSLGRSWQCGTIQCDMQLPERFDLTYVGVDGAKHRPVMIHRTCFGSIERFIGVLTEHCAGAFPFWLTPVQAVIIPISEKHHEAARGVLAQLEEAGIRAELDDRNEKMGFKIREAQLQKIPMMLVLGDKEVEENKVALRSREHGDEGSHDLAVLIEKWKKDSDF
ncbi:MAG: threonine--tRNA ligase [Defluviitaleaceae bacterium]|nr:threonine--tRNA ligase [Defluviitaleaceae bacterium]MCL2274680.1 threonine--tRNA ligase [Defluviitaleaceae bacterium]MCL2275759.1 threonine--tRNA ligase [Defluviitaleaceae bacterium]